MVEFSSPHAVDGFCPSFSHLEYTLFLASLLKVSFDFLNRKEIIAAFSVCVCESVCVCVRARILCD